MDQIIAFNDEAVVASAAEADERHEPPIGLPGDLIDGRTVGVLELLEARHVRLGRNNGISPVVPVAVGCRPVVERGRIDFARYGIVGHGNRRCLKGDEDHKVHETAHSVCTPGRLGQV